MKSTIVIYHAHCHDGFSGAWAAYKKLGNKADYIGAANQEPPPAGLKNKTIYFIDLIYPADIFKKIVADNKKVIAIDHHLSAADHIKIAHEYVFDLKNSGAFLAWKYFHPQKPMPFLIELVDDDDLWKFKIPKQRELAIAIADKKFNFPTWNRLAHEFENETLRNKYIEKGALLLKFKQQQIAELVDFNSYLVEFAGHEALAVNAPHFFTSELGHQLALKQPPFGIVWSHLGRKIRVSLRGNGKIDVSKICQQYGGGGHVNAAGFSWPIDKKLPWKVIS